MMAREMGGVIQEQIRLGQWTEWKKCFMIQRRESITGKMIWGFGLMRKCYGPFEMPNELGYYYAFGKQFAESKQEIFIHKLKGM